MVVLLVLSSLASTVAAVLALLAWRAAQKHDRSASPDPALQQAVTTLQQSVAAVQQSVATLGTSMREEQERLRAGQTADSDRTRGEIRQQHATLRQELHSAAQESQQGLLAAIQKMSADAAETAVRMLNLQSAALDGLRTSTAKELTSLRTELQKSLQDGQQSLAVALETMRSAADEHQHKQAVAAKDSAQEVSASQRSALTELKTSMQQQLKDLVERNDLSRKELVESLTAARKEQTISLQQLREAHADTSRALVIALSEEQQRSRQEVATSLNTLMKSNEGKLEQMRATVQEKLDATLGERLDASFRQVSERLESVHKGLGEMQTLAQGVGSLQRTLTNVKTRGAWAELQLEALLVDLLTPGQYERQFRINPDSTELVDFAVRLPGNTEDRPVWLAIDSKFPMDVYERFLAAWEAADPEAVRQCSKALTDRIKKEAQSIRSKYVNPPHTTDFAVMYLPTEGLFAEVVRQPGLIHDLRTQHQVVVAGPTTLTALIGSMSMGFRTLAIQKRSSEAWQVLGQVKSEFEKSGVVWEKIVKQLDTARNTAHSAGVRHRAIERRLRIVETAPLDSPLARSLAMLEDGEESSAVVVPGQGGAPDQ